VNPRSAREAVAEEREILTFEPLPELDLDGRGSMCE